MTQPLSLHAAAAPSQKRQVATTEQLAPWLG